MLLEFLHHHRLEQFWLVQYANDPNTQPVISASYVHAEAQQKPGYICFVPPLYICITSMLHVCFAYQAQHVPFTLA